MYMYMCNMYVVVAREVLSKYRIVTRFEGTNMHCMIILL